MKGASAIREQGYKDPLLTKVMKEHGLEEIPLYKHRPPEQMAQRKRWSDLAKFRDGPVNPKRAEIDDIQRAATDIKRFAFKLGADDVGIARRVNQELADLVLRPNADA